MASQRQRRRTRLYPLLGMLVLVVLLAVLTTSVVRYLADRSTVVTRDDEQCRVQVGDQYSSLDLEQSRNAAVVVAESVRRGLPARAASIALATAMQESKLRNIDYGDRDSVGLFQQRPSQGWGTVAQIMDPWYASGKFYDALVKVPGWQSGDLNDVAQQVQRSGVPDGYRQHVTAAKIWASALTGHSPAALTCVARPTGNTSGTHGNEVVGRAFGRAVTVTPGQARVTLSSADQTRLWSATQLYLATTGTSGVTSITVGQRTWTMDPDHLAGWQGTDSKAAEAVIGLRA